MVVTALKAGQAAERAGLAVGDVIRSLNGRPTPSKAAFLLALRGLRPGDPAPVDLRRGGRDAHASLVVGGRGWSADAVDALRREAGIAVHEQTQPEFATPAAS